MSIFTPERKTINKYKRTDVRITDEYVDSILKWTTPRDHEILKALVKYPFLSTSQIEMIIFNNLSPSSWRNKALERLRKLYQANCIDRWFPMVEEGAGSSEAHYILDYAGARALAKQLGYTRKEFKFRKLNYVPQDYRHTLKIFDFKALLYVLNRQLGYTDEGTRGEILHWSNEVHYKFVHAENGKVKKQTIIPDAFCIYQNEPLSNPKIFFLEIDNSTEPIQTLKSKIINYSNFHQSGAWREERWFRVVRRFPTVCFTFHEQEKVDEMVAYIKRTKTNIRFLFTTYDRLFDDKFKEYKSNSGKRRLVLQERKVNILDDIWDGKNGREGL